MKCKEKFPPVLNLNIPFCDFEEIVWVGHSLARLKTMTGRTKILSIEIIVLNVAHRSHQLENTRQGFTRKNNSKTNSHL